MMVYDTMSPFGWCVLLTARKANSSSKLEEIRKKEHIYTSIQLGDMILEM